MPEKWKNESCALSRRYSQQCSNGESGWRSTYREPFIRSKLMKLDVANLHPSFQCPCHSLLFASFAMRLSQKCPEHETAKQYCLREPLEAFLRWHSKLLTLEIVVRRLWGAPCSKRRDTIHFYRKMREARKLKVRPTLVAGASTRSSNLLSPESQAKNEPILRLFPH